MKRTKKSFIADQISCGKNKKTALLAFEIRKAIIEYKLNEGENENAFSVDASYDEGKFYARCSFSEDTSMTVMYHEDTENEIVASLFSLENEKVMVDLAELMIEEGWVSGLESK